MFIPFMILVWMILVHPSTFYFIEKPHLEHRFGIRIAIYNPYNGPIVWTILYSVDPVLIATNASYKSAEGHQEKCSHMCQSGKKLK